MADNPRVLLVEDNAEYRILVSEFLNEAGFSVFTAQDASEALGLLQSLDLNWYALVTDWEMPKGGGRALLTGLMSWPHAFKKKIVLSSHDFRGNLEVLHFQKHGVCFLRKIEDGVSALIEALQS